MALKSEIDLFHQRMEKIASPFKKEWQEKYLKEVIPFLGVGIPEIRKLLKEWYREKAYAETPVQQQLKIARQLLDRNIAEDKLAGILVVQLFVLKPENYRAILDLVEELYDEEKIFDWNTGDWLCIRLLTPMIEDGLKEYIDRIVAWKDSAYLWKARASAVSFAQVKNKEPYKKEIEGISTVLIKEPDRFAKTAVGWLLREISREDKEFVAGFVKKNAPYFTKEILLNALKYHPKELGKYYF